MDLSKTRIVAFGLTEKAVTRIDEQAFEIYYGSYGDKLDCRLYSNNISLNCNIPSNLQEYDIQILSFDAIKTEQNFVSQNERLSSKDRSYYFYCKRPITLFDPVPFVCKEYIISEFNKKKKPYIRFIFVSDLIEDKTTYHYCIDSTEGKRYESIDVHANDVFLFESFKKRGSIVKLCEKASSSMKKILWKYLEDFKYYRVLYADCQNCFPLLENDDGEIVGSARINEKQITVVLPELADPDKKGSLISDLIRSLFVDLLPELFPEMINKKWINDSRFKSQEEKELEHEISLLEERFLNDKAELEKRKNKIRFERQFLLDILTSDSELLVSSVVKFFKWLGFTDVENCDETRTKKEEDIKIAIGQDQLLIEVKGISNLPQERDCSQIDKIINRRKKPGYQGTIHPVFIVNHEKNIIPTQRNRNVFTDQEIEDAVGMERSLITTWDMYKAYEQIEKGVLTKQYVRDCFWKTGLVRFEYPSEKKIGTITRIYHEGLVGIVFINEIGITRGDVLVYGRDNDWKTITILKIMRGKNEITTAQREEVSVEFDSNVNKDGGIFQRIIDEDNTKND